MEKIPVNYRLEYLVRDLYLESHDPDPGEFVYHVPHEITVRLRRPTDDEVRAGLPPRDAVCTVLCQRKTRADIHKVMADIAHPTTESETDLTFESLPAGFQSFSN